MSDLRVGSTKRIAIVVLGMHRSGTSALTRMLSLLGAHLPEHLLGANPTNKAGHWEPQLLVNLHDRMLAEAGSRWDDWRAFDEEALPPGRLEHYQNEIARIIAEDYGNAPLIVLKDPRICRFVPLYERALAELGYEPRYVLPLRNPVSVIASLAKRDDMAPGFAALLWLRHVLDGELSTRGRHRAFVSYESVIGDWKAAAEHIGRHLNIQWPRSIKDAEREIDAHISRDLQHHSASLSDLVDNPDVEGWVQDAYKARVELADRPESNEATSRLTAVSETFDAASVIFGRATFPAIKRLQELEKRARDQAHEAEAKLKRMSEMKAQWERDFFNLRDSYLLHKRDTERLIAEIYALRTSTSWKITRPLRALRRAFA